jgi:hypothetical protein
VDSGTGPIIQKPTIAPKIETPAAAAGVSISASLFRVVGLCLLETATYLM